MPIFVHLTVESRIPLIRKNGISRLRNLDKPIIKGIFAVPVTRNFYASHQWLRELKRRNQGPIAAVYFRIPDKQLVWFGHFGQNHRLITAAEAVAVFSGADETLGWEVIVP